MKLKSNYFIVFLLPALLMIVIAGSGYMYLKNDHSDELTNESLKEQIDWTASENGTTVEVSWEWPGMPSDGIFGDDYIGIVGPVKEVHVELHASDGVLYEGIGEPVENGWIITYPNRLEENKSLGTLGTVFIELESEESSIEDLSLYHLHTWSEHAPLETDDATLTDPTFGEATNVPYWLKEIEVVSNVR